MANAHRRALWARLALPVTMAVAMAGPAISQPAQETPLSMVEALHTAFGEHHARAVHTNGVILEGSFTPDNGAVALTSEPIFAGGTRPVVSRFSLFAGVPGLPDNDNGAAPAGWAFKVKAADGDDFDVEANQHSSFVVKTFDEFAVFLRALAASGGGVAHPTPLEQFLAGHPKAAQFLASLTYPASYAQATYFGVNALKFTNAAGHSVFVRYQFKPVAGERYLTTEERKAAGPTYLRDELAKRIAAGPITFDWYAQIAEPGDAIDDPSTAWPETRRLARLGRVSVTKINADPVVDRTLLFLPGQQHPGVEAADPMLVLRNTAYPISLGERQ